MSKVDEAAAKQMVCPSAMDLVQIVHYLGHFGPHKLPLEEQDEDPLNTASFSPTSKDWLAPFLAAADIFYAASRVAQEYGMNRGKVLDEVAERYATREEWFRNRSGEEIAINSAAEQLKLSPGGLRKAFKKYGLLGVGNEIDTGHLRHLISLRRQEIRESNAKRKKRSRARRDLNSSSKAG